ACLEHEALLAAAHLEAAFQHVDRFFLDVVDVQRRTAARRHLDDEIVQEPPGLLARKLEDQVASGPRLKAQAAIGRQEDRLEGCSLGAQCVVHLTLLMISVDARKHRSGRAGMVETGSVTGFSNSESRWTGTISSTSSPSRARAA